MNAQIPRSALNRREFLASTALAATGAMFVPRSIWAIPARSSRAVESFAPPLMAPEHLRTLATTVLDAAVQAGAQFADVRVSDLRSFSGGDQSGNQLAFRFGCGIRARIAGRDAFIATADPTLDGLAHAARSVVAAARDLAGDSTTEAPLAPTPMVTGEWATPIEIDPFSISPDEHVAVVHGLNSFGRRAIAKTFTEFYVGGIQWDSETRVFASSDGTLLTQHTLLAMPGASLRVNDSSAGASLGVSGFGPQSVGVEAFLGNAVHERFESAVDEYATLLGYPTTMGEVGRKPVVLDGQAFSLLIGQTLVPALTMNRVSGEEQNSVGTSFLVPPEAVLGQPLFAPVLQLQVNSTTPAFRAAKWDDDGIATAPTVLIEDGKVMRYLGTRHNPPAGTTPPVLGTAFAANVMTAPSPCPGAFKIAPAAHGMSLPNLIATVRDGYLVRNARIHPDQQGMGGVLMPEMLFEVKRGRIARRVVGTRLEFSTKKVLHAIPALGNAETVADTSTTITGGLPTSNTLFTLRGPAAVTTEMNIVPNRR